MPTPTKFTAENREKIIQALSVGASRTTAAHIAGVNEAQVRRWVKRGEDSAEGTRYRQFYEEVLKAEASPRMRALGIVYKDLPDRPDLAWKYIERREPGYAPPMPNLPVQTTAPVVVTLSFQSGPGSLALALPEPEVIEGEVVEDEQDLSPDPAPPAPA